MKHGTAWKLAMLVISVAYVAAEIIFNSMLVSVAGGTNLTPETLHNVELFGRTMAGVGLTVVVGDALTSDARVQRISRKLLVFVLVALLCWPTMFFGQKMLIDAALVEPSSPTERQRAYFSQLLRSALANESVRIEGLEFERDPTEDPEAQTFLTLFGGLVYADAALVDRLDERRAEILGKFIRNKANEKFDEYYERYKRLKAEIDENYKRYRQGTRKVENERAAIPERQAEARQTVEDKVHAGWQKYQKLTRAHNARRRARAEQVAEIAYDYFEDVNDEHCDDRDCVRRARNDYDENMEDLELGDIPPKHWLIREDVSTAENIGKTLLGAALTSGVSVAAQLVNAAQGGDGGWKDEKLTYTNSAQHYAERLREPMADEFVDESGGYEPGIKTLGAFRRHAETAKRAREKIASEHGIELPIDWRVTDHATLNQAVRDHVEGRISARWQAKAVEEYGLDIAPGQSYDAFQRHPDIQRRIKERMGSYYVEPTLATWGRSEFYQQLMEPAIEREVQAQLDRLEASKALFADGEVHADKGKKALRAVLVPPIAMILSLFFVMITLFKLPAKLVLLLRGKGEQRASTPDSGSAVDASSAQAPGEPTAGPAKRASLWRKFGVKIGLVLLVLLIVFGGPMFAGRGTLTQDSEGPVDYLLEQIERNAQPGIAYAMRWALQAQPLMLPIGQSLERHIGIFAWFSKHNGAVAALDAAMREAHGSGHSTGHDAAVMQTTTRLRVRRGPSTDAREVTVLDKGTEVVVLDRVEEVPWVEIERGPRPVYVHSDYLE